MSNAVDTAQFQNLAEMFFAVAAKMGAKPFTWAKKEGQWVSTSWDEAAAQVRALAGALRALGVKEGDRVALVAENRPEWAAADVAIMAAGGISVPTYITNTVADHRHVLTDSGAKVVIVSTPRLVEAVLGAAAEAPSVEAIVAIDPCPNPPARPRPRFVTCGEALALGRAVDPATLAQRKRTDTACFIYTSGTGGVPKGVMLSHGAILANRKGATILLETLGLDDETFLSFLPLSHSYEHTAGLFFPISVGAQIYYAEGADKLAANLPEARPTIMTAVPRLYETMHQRILAGVERQGGLKAKLFHRALALGIKHYEDPASLGLGERLMHRLLDKLVRDKVRARFGGRLKAMVSGGAPLNPEIGLFFTALGVRILQGYGLTECGPVANCNPPPRVKIRTVGPVIHGVELRLAEDGEILIRGENLMQGYWGLPELSAQTVREGWLYTGDIGMLDDDGYLQITDRKKDIIVNSGGDNIAPQRVEGMLTLRPEIAQAMVVGDRRPYLVGVIVPRQEFLEGFAKQHGYKPDLKALADDPDLHRALLTAIEKVNTGLSVIERVRRFVIASEPFGIDNGMMTPSMKVRRHIVRQAYGEKLERLYQQPAAGGLPTGGTDRVPLRSLSMSAAWPLSDRGLAMLSKLHFWSKRLGEKLWIRPLLFCLMAVAAAFAAAGADGLGLEVFPKIEHDTVEKLLSIIAASMLGVATFAVASMVSAYASVSNSATPRAFGLVLVDDMSKTALSTFIAAFIFSVIALVAIKTGFYGRTGLFLIFVMTIGVLTWVVFAFIRWVDQIARLGRLGNTIDRVERATEAAIRRRRAAPFLGAIPADPEADPGEPIYSDKIGYVQHIDVPALQDCAEKQGLVLTIAALTGTFVGPGRAIAHVLRADSAKRSSDLDPARIAAAFSIGRDRAFDDDPRFGLVVLSEIAARALSPAVNDPGTAIGILGNFVRLMALWVAPQEDDERDRKVLHDRIRVPALTVDDMFEDAFTAIARDGAGTLEVAIRLQKAFLALATLPNPEMRSAARRHSALALARAEIAMTLLQDLDRVRLQARKVA